MREVKHLIDGKSVESVNGRTYDRLNPVSGAIATRAAAAGVEDINAAVQAAAAAFPAWAETGPGRRRELLMNDAEALSSRQAEFAEAMIGEVGATEGWAAFNVNFAATLLREAASMSTQLTGEVIPSDVPGNLAMAIRQPRGVCAGIAPWNAPVILGVRAMAAPLVCGNTVVFKASEVCPAVHRLIGAALEDAGFPRGVLNVIMNAPEDAPAIVEAIIDHPSVRHINFTGSTRVGKIIAQRAATHLKPVLLELGGKAPLIVLADADVEAAVDAAVFGAFANQGQICMSTERIIVDTRIAGQFVSRLVQRASALPLQDPSSGPTVLGSVVDRRAADRIAELITDAKGKGARVMSNGSGDGTLLPATVIDGVTPEMRVYSEESFGPVVSVVRVNDDKEALRVANDTEYGLSAAVFSRDIARAWAIARNVESGICHINGPTVHDEPQMPFGGVKASGYGRFGGRAAIEEFTVLRWITIQTAARHYPF